ncbi:hypothetical protein GCM10009676_20810 [Prauserella halophila]|uniref:DUF397 domain-containing protein n=1 Tax=Prauserella halophila TaxID=185641 RepID=A0ABP4GTU0_9PSEU|nr:DUF397 domain-containing protein [Prauserella halophila]MCP2235725.1 protein of unknown function (DUF397) [Prauserella halophila]
MINLEACEWRKSSYSGGGDSGQDCVEATVQPAVVGLRDTTDREGGYLAVSRDAFAALLADVNA